MPYINRTDPVGDFSEQTQLLEMTVSLFILMATSKSRFYAQVVGIGVRYADFIHERCIVKICTRSSGLWVGLHHSLHAAAENQPDPQQYQRSTDHRPDPQGLTQEKPAQQQRDDWIDIGVSGHKAQRQ